MPLCSKWSPFATMLLILLIKPTGLYGQPAAETTSPTENSIRNAGCGHQTERKMAISCVTSMPAWPQNLIFEISWFIIQNQCHGRVARICGGKSLQPG